MTISLADFQRPFFIGIAGSGMSAIAQYLKEMGKQVSGSDRFFQTGEFNEIKNKLELAGIPCFVQDGQGITEQNDLVVVSAAIEEKVGEMQKARQLHIPVITRAELLALIAQSKKTIAVGGTSGKSTTVGMLFQVLEFAGLEPGLITGAGLVSLIKQGLLGNAQLGQGEWLIIEADESDGSIVHYKPEIGILLNVDKDHKEIESLMELFQVFKDNSKKFIVNQENSLAKKLSQKKSFDFSSSPEPGIIYTATDFVQKGLNIFFRIHEVPFSLNLIGKHNMENALAAITTAAQIGIPLETCSRALQDYQGIYRRHQVLGNKNGTWLIDDYAHNPVKCAAAISACQPIASKLVAWFQPHGYGPTKFLRHDFVREIASVLRKEDEIWMSEIFYAGGTTTKDISANDLINDLKALGKSAYFVENRDYFLEEVRPHLSNDTVLLLMGARDPSLEDFAMQVWKKL